MPHGALQLLCPGVLIVALTLAGCGSNPGPGVLEPVAKEAQGTKTVRLLVATNRKLDAATASFGFQRTYAMSYQAVAISIPPNHKSGEIEWPDEKQGDPAKSFVTRERDNLDVARFRVRLSAQLDKSGEVLVFTHGFNTKYQEAVFRMAQIAADSGFGGAHVLFSWPSEGEVPGYLRDRESANFSRDQFEAFMRLVASTPGVRKVNLMAHSMGNWLAVEMLRQAKLKGDMEFGGKLGHIILASPDIDSQVFQTQLDQIGRRKPPIVIFVSRNDKALQLSSKVAGDIPRVGNVVLDDPKVKAAIQKFGLVVIDAGEVHSADPLGHGTFASAPKIIQGIGKQLNASIGDSVKESAGVVVLDAAGAVLSAPANILSTVTGR